MKFFLLDFFYRMNCKNHNGAMLENIFYEIFSQFFKIRVECPFKLRIFIVTTLVNCFARLSNI